MNVDVQARSAGKVPWKPIGVAVLASIAAHLLGALVLRATAVTESPPLFKPPLVTFLSPTSEAASIRKFREDMELADPSVSALPNPHGFSRTTIRRDRQVPSLIEARKDDPQFLLREQTDPSEMTSVVESTLPALLASHGSKEPAAAVELFDDVMEGHLSYRSGSGYLQSGEIRDRPLLSLASIPFVRNPAPALPSVVRVAVSPLGEVKFALLEKSSGSDEKDARALDIIRRWRFQVARETTGDQWGTVSIYWSAEPMKPAAPVPTPVETNTTPVEMNQPPASESAPP